MTLAELVGQEHDALVALLLQSVRRVPEAERAELADSMSLFLNDLEEALTDGTEPPAYDAKPRPADPQSDRAAHQLLLMADLILRRADEQRVATTARDLRTLLRAVAHGSAAAAAAVEENGPASGPKERSRESEHAGFLVHEVRNSLASARFAFDLLRRRNFVDPQPLVEIIDGGLRQASRQVDDALVGVRLRGGGVSRIRVFPSSMLREITAELRLQAEARQLTLAIDAPEAITLQADPRLLRSALSNLVHNAIKFSRPGGTVAVRVAASGGVVTFEIDDACGGIPAETMERLFRPFVQGAEERTGFGLGLAIARECTEAQGGSLRVHNVGDHGCRFVLTLPQRS